MRRDPGLPMREIRHCPACLTYVYSDARRCHGCGERTGRRGILTRGSWIFIVLAATGFAIGRGIDLQQDKRDRIRREIERAASINTVNTFVKGWLTGDEAAIARVSLKCD